jgi:choline kinase
MRAEGEKIIELSRTIPSEAASGEFIGVAKFTPSGVAELFDAFDRTRTRFAGQVFREKRTFERAYLIDLFQDMIEKGSSFHRVDTHGGYMEIDTLQDESLAASWWTPKA